MLNGRRPLSAFPPELLNRKRGENANSERYVRLLQNPRSPILPQRFPASPAIGKIWSTGDLHEKLHPCASHPTGQPDAGAGDLRNCSIGADDFAHDASGAKHTFAIHKLTQPALGLPTRTERPAGKLRKQPASVTSPRTANR